MKLHYLLLTSFTPLKHELFHVEESDEGKWRKPCVFSSGFQSFIDLAKLHLGLTAFLLFCHKKQGTHHDVMPVHLGLLRGQFLTFQLQTERKQKTVTWVTE